MKALPGEQLWRQAYQSEFGAAPTDFADLYYDAASLLLRRLQDVATVVGGKLVIDRRRSPPRCEARPASRA